MTNDWDKIDLDTLQHVANILKSEGYELTGESIATIYYQLYDLRDKQTKEAEKKIPALFKPIPKEDE